MDYELPEGYSLVEEQPIKDDNATQISERTNVSEGDLPVGYTLQTTNTQEQKQEDKNKFEYLRDVADEVVGTVSDVASDVADTVSKNIEPAYNVASRFVENKIDQSKLMVMMARRPVLGMAQWATEVFGDDEEGKRIVEDIANNEQAILDTAKRMGLTKNDLQNQEIMSEVLMSVLPADKAFKVFNAIKNPVVKRTAQAIGTGTGEAVLAGATQSGKEEAVFSKEAQTAATVAGTIGAVAPLAIEKVILPVLGKSFNAVTVANNFIKELSTANASPEKSYGYLLRKIGATTKDADGWNKAYSEAIGKDVNKFTAEDKIAALLNNSENGSILKKQAEYFGGGDVLSKQAQREELFKEMVFNETKDGSLTVPSLQLKKYLDDSKTLYGEVENILIDNYNKTIKIPSSEISGLEDLLTRSSMKADDVIVVKRVIDDLKEGVDSGISVDRLLAMKHELNSINLKSTKEWKAGQVGDLIDSYIKEGVGDDGYEVWKAVNQRYAAKSLLESDNKVAKLLIEGYEGVTNFKVVADELIKLDRGAGYKTFNQIRLALGEEVSKKLELEIINTAFSKSANTADAIKILENMDFATTKGGTVKAEIERLKGLIPEEDARTLINKTLGLPDNAKVGWSDDLFAKARYGVIGEIWQEVTKRLPFNGVAQEKRVFAQVADQIKKADFKGKILSKDSDIMDEAFKEQERIFLEKIKALKEKGELRTAAENKQLAEITAQAKKIQKYIEYKPRGKRGLDKQKDIPMVKDNALPDLNVARPSTRQEQMNVIERTKKKDVVQGEIVEDATPQIPYKNNSSSIIDVDIAELKKSTKKLTPEQANFSNKVTSQINLNLDIIKKLDYEMKQIPKSGLSGAKKKQRASDITEKIRAIKAENVTLKKKLPKVERN